MKKKTGWPKEEPSKNLVGTWPTHPPSIRIATANVHPHTIYFVRYFLLLALYPKNLMLECFPFSPTTESLYDDE